MTVDELGRQTKSKYPEYGSLGDAEVGARVLSKYSQYGSQVDGKSISDVREQVEPGLMGETDPTGQKLLENAAIAGGGYALPGTVKAIASIPSRIKGFLGSSETPLLRSLGKNTQELGKEYIAQNEAIGVTRRVPVESGMKVRMSPVHGNPPPEIVPSQYPRNTGAFMNYANSKLRGFGDKMNPQELMDWQVKLQTDMSNGTIPKIDPTSGRITTVYQQATDLLRRTKEAFNAQANPLIGKADLPKGVMPTREGLDKAFGYSASQESLIKGLKKAGKYATLAALGLGSGNAILNRITGR